MPSLLDKLAAVEAPLTEEVAECPLCGSSVSEFLFWNCDRLFHLPGKFGIVRCSACQLVRLSPRPVREVADFYYPDKEYYTYQLPEVPSSERKGGSRLRDASRDLVRDSVIGSLGYPVRLNVLQRLLQPVFVRFFFAQGTRGWEEKLPRYVTEGSVLDIGCGNGAFLGLLQELGWKAKGVEMNRRAAEIARSYFGLDVFHGTLEDAEFPDASFDYIHISHVLEHVYDAGTFLNKVKRLLKPGGTLYIELPNFESFGQAESREFWYAWETPRHVSMYSPKTLRLQVENSGFTVVRLATQIGDFWSWDLTYRSENKMAEKLDPRPSHGPRLDAEAEDLRHEAAVRFRGDPLCGDIITCWLKPAD